MEPRRTSASLAVLAAVLLALSACGTGTGSGTADTGTDTGQVLVGLTDAEGDFVRYAVDVDRLELTRADGTVVEALPLETRIDFAELTDLTEFLTAATVPQGAYVSATLSLDYSDAEILVEGPDGSPVEAVATDETGTPLTTLELRVELSNRHRLVVAPGVPALLTLDFDLEATHEVDLSVSPARVTVEPVLVAEVNPDTPKPHRVRGPLVSVDEAHGAFVIAIRPHWIRHKRDLGRLTVITGDGTSFEVDGQTASGSEGLALLAAMPSGTAVVAKGSLDPATRAFRAEEVYAGSSVPGGELDVLTGVVVARSGGVLTVHGATLDRQDGALYLKEVELPLDDAVRITKQGDPGAALTPDAISVAQRIRAFGQYEAQDGTPVFRAEHIRLLVTRIAGTATGVEEGELRLALQHIQGRRPARFDFSGTGSAPEDDADPADYQVDTGDLPLSNLEAGDPVRVFGFVAPFGAAPPDFTALTVADASEAVARLAVRWTWNSAGELEADAEKLVLDLSASPLLHHVFQTGIATELDSDPSPVVEPEDAERGVFAIHRRSGGTAVYSRFADFAEALAGELASGLHVRFLGAKGRFDSSTQTFTARRIVVRLH